jgi:hypothetical protein
MRLAGSRETGRKEMTLAFIVWLVMTAIPALKMMGLVLLIGTVIGAGGCFIHDMDEEEYTALNWLRKKLRIILLLILTSFMLPDKEATWYMVGAYGTQKIIESPVAQDFAADGVDVLKSLMKKAKENIHETK